MTKNVSASIFNKAVLKCQSALFGLTSLEAAVPETKPYERHENFLHGHTLLNSQLNLLVNLFYIVQLKSPSKIFLRFAQFV